MKGIQVIPGRFSRYRTTVCFSGLRKSVGTYYNLPLAKRAVAEAHAMIAHKGYLSDADISRIKKRYGKQPSNNKARYAHAGFNVYEREGGYVAQCRYLSKTKYLGKFLKQKYANAMVFMAKQFYKENGRLTRVDIEKMRMDILATYPDAFGPHIKTRLSRKMARLAG